MTTLAFHPRKLFPLLLAALLCVSQTVRADEREDLEKLRATVLALIDTLVKNRVLPRDKADAMMRDAEARATARLAQLPQLPPPDVGADGKKIVRVAYVPEAVKTTMREQIKAEVLAETRNGRAAGDNSGEWADRIKIEGDLRLRGEATRLDAGNTSAVAVASANSELTRAADIASNTSNGLHNVNTQEDSNRTRLRARLGVTAKVSDSVSAGLMLSTGNTTGPTSTNQTMAQNGYFNKYALVVDRAYLKLEPDRWLSLSGGRMPNPFFSTDLVWAEDLNFEGFSASLRPRLSDMTTAYLTAGWFPLSTNSPLQSSSRSLRAAQAGVDWKIGQKDSVVKVGAALYDYHGIEGAAEQILPGYPGSPPNYGTRSEYAAGYRQRGNTLFKLNAVGDTGPTYWGLASGFRELDLTAMLDIAQSEAMHLVLTGDLVKNLSFKRDKMAARTGKAITDGHGLGYMVRALVGAPQITKSGQWNASLGYRYLGSDAVVDAFTNSDFGLGGTNKKGIVLGVGYGIAKNTWLSARWLSSELIDSLVPATATSAANTKFRADLLQIDLNTRF